MTHFLWKNIPNRVQANQKNYSSCCQGVEKKSKLLKKYPKGFVISKKKLSAKKCKKFYARIDIFDQKKLTI